MKESGNEINHQGNEKNKKGSYRVLVIIGLIVISLWFGSWLAIQGFYGWDNDNNRGTFGDMFGAVNALFSGLAFAGIIYTITMQREELSLQRKSTQMQTDELRLQREAIQLQTHETSRSADQLEQQRELMDFQISLSTLVQIIETKNKHLASINLTLDGKTRNGYDAIDDLSNSIIQYDQRTDFSNNSSLRLFYVSIILMCQHVKDCGLSQMRFNILKNYITLNLLDSEAIIAYSASEKSEYQRKLLEEFGLNKRYERYRKP